MTEIFPPLSPHPSLKVYFDSGVRHARKGQPARAWVGYAVFAGTATQPSERLETHRAEAGLGDAIGYWHKDGKRLLERVDEVVAQYPVAQGSQLYDLVAAHAAVSYLSTRGYLGAVRLIGDGRNVIDFLNGTETGLYLEVAGQDLARTIRDHIRAETAHMHNFTWEWVPTSENWADRLNKDRDRQKRKLRPFVGKPK